MWSSHTCETSTSAGSSSAHFQLVTQWKLRADLHEVISVLRRPEELPRWWPSVFLATEVLRRGDHHELGTRVAVHAKGWLPYTVRFTFEIAESLPPWELTVQVWGDLQGNCRVLVVESDRGVEVIWNWQCTVRRPFLRVLARLVHCLGGSNHGWTMKRGCRSLQLEIDRRRGATLTAHSRPPGPVPHDRATQAFLRLLRG